LEVIALTLSVVIYLFVSIIHKFNIL
jgi:hypothetical protein